MEKRLLFCEELIFLAKPNSFSFSFSKKKRNFKKTTHTILLFWKNPKKGNGKVNFWLWVLIFFL
jgi:hypothetical protein